MNTYLFISDIVKYCAIIYVAYRLLVEFEMVLKPIYKKVRSRLPKFR